MLERYNHGSSVCAAKVRFALAEKGLNWPGHYIDVLKGDQFDPAWSVLTFCAPNNRELNWHSCRPNKQ
jgi:glutathione S-transferase